MFALARQPGLSLAGFAAMDESDRADLMRGLGAAQKALPAVGTVNRVYIPNRKKFKIEQVQLVNGKPKWVFIGMEDPPRGKVDKAVAKNADPTTFSPTLNPSGQIIKADKAAPWASRPVLAPLTPGKPGTVLPGFTIAKATTPGAAPVLVAPAAASSPQALPPVLTMPAASPAPEPVPASLPFPGVTPSAPEDYSAGWDAVPLDPSQDDGGFAVEAVPEWNAEPVIDGGGSWDFVPEPEPSTGTWDESAYFDQSAGFDYQDYVLSGLRGQGMGSWFSKAAKSIAPVIGAISPALSLIPGVGAALAPAAGLLSKLMPQAGQPNESGQSALQQILQLIGQVGGAIVQDKTSTTAKVFQAVQKGAAPTLPPGVFQGPDGKLYRIVPKQTAQAAAKKNGTAEVAVPRAGIDPTTLLLVGGALLLAARK